MRVFSLSFAVIAVFGLAACGGSPEPVAVSSPAPAADATPSPTWQVPTRPAEATTPAADATPPAAGAAAPRTILAAPDAAAEAGSARFSMTLTMTAPEVPDGSVTITGDGGARFDERVVGFVMDFGSLGGAAEMRQLGDVLYMRMDMLEEFLPPGRPWIRMDLNEFGAELGLDLRDFQQLSQNSDPTMTLELLRGVSNDVDVVDTEEVRGVPTTHYRAKVDLDRALEEVPVDLREQIRQAAELSGLPDVYPVDVWIDDEGLPRRMTQTIEITPPDGSGTVEQDVLIEMFDYGVEIDVDAPSADETIDIFELAESAPTG